MSGAFLPQLAGEGGAERRMGYGPLPQTKLDCRVVTANFHRFIPAFHTHPALRVPASRRKGELAGLLFSRCRAAGDGRK